MLKKRRKSSGKNWLVIGFVIFKICLVFDLLYCIYINVQIESYISQRELLLRIYVLLDARHGPSVSLFAVIELFLGWLLTLFSFTL